MSANGLSHRDARRLLVVGAVAVSTLTPAAQVGPARADHVMTVTVDSQDIDGTTTPEPLIAGATYLLTARGSYTYQYDRAGMLADAECTTNDLASAPREVPKQVPVPRWQRERYAFFYTGDVDDPARTDLYDPDPTDDATDLYVDGRDVEWLPLGSVGRGGCADTTHDYVTLFTPTVTRHVDLRVFDLHHDDNRGTLEVSIQHVAGAPLGLGAAVHLATVNVHSRDADGSATPVLAAGRRHLLLARGLYTWGRTTGGGLPLADAECSRTETDATYRGHRFPATSTSEDPLDLVLDGTAITWRPVTGGPAGTCDPVLHWYVAEVVGEGAAVQLRIDDPHASDDAGALSVDVLELL